MSNQQTFKAIKSIVQSFLPDAQVLLFGSRGRGEESIGSDYDLLVITNDTLAPRIKMNWESKIRKALVYSLNAAFDVILQSKNELREKRELPGHIVHFAMKDAIEI